VFALTERGREGFGQQYDDLAVLALRFLAEKHGEAGLREFARRRASFIRRGFETVSAADPSLSPAQVLARVFSEAGYAASVRGLPPLNGTTAGDQLCQQHCPVSHVAHEFPELCEAETAVISQLLGTHVQRLATIAHGNDVCTTSIPDAPPGQATEPAQMNEKEQVTA
jgi:predicted ArsR family transcriptional regulator